MNRHTSEAESIERAVNRRSKRWMSTVGAGNLNDTKWIDIFGVISASAFDELQVTMKMVGSDNVREGGRFRTVNLKWTDSSYGPFLNRDVEWIKIGGAGATELRKRLERLGRLLPLVDCEGGFKIQAYGICRSSEVAAALVDTGGA